MSDKAWGQSKKTFYNADDVEGMGGSEEEEEAAELEEKEAMMLQKRLAAGLDQEDFAAMDIAVCVVCCVGVYVCGFIYMCICVCIYVDVYMYICMYVYMYVGTYMCMCVSIFVLLHLVFCVPLCCIYIAMGLFYKCGASLHLYASDVVLVCCHV